MVKRVAKYVVSYIDLFFFFYSWVRFIFNLISYAIGHISKLVKMDRNKFFWIYFIISKHSLFIRCCWWTVPMSWALLWSHSPLKWILVSMRGMWEGHPPQCLQCLCPLQWKPHPLWLALSWLHDATALCPAFAVCGLWSEEICVRNSYFIYHIAT